VTVWHLTQGQLLITGVEGWSPPTAHGAAKTCVRRPPKASVIATKCCVRRKDRLPSPQTAYAVGPHVPITPALCISRLRGPVLIMEFLHGKSRRRRHAGLFTMESHAR
jgi:hypothetical protein